MIILSLYVFLCARVVCDLYEYNEHDLPQTFFLVKRADFLPGAFLKMSSCFFFSFLRLYSKILLMQTQSTEIAAKYF